MRTPLHAAALAALLLGPANRLVGADADWSSWSGPLGTFAAEAGIPVVDTLSEARLLWKSECRLLPMREQSLADADGRATYRTPGGGGSSPVIADGAVYLSQTVPSGTVTDANRAKKTGRSSNPTHPDLDKIDADDRVIRLDAATGKTLWTRDFPGQGVHWVSGDAGPTNPTPVVGAGVVLAVGSLGVARGLDIRDGTVLWESPLGTRAAKYREMKASALAKASSEPLNVYGRDLAGAPAFIGGRFLLPDWENDLTCGLLALDPATGREVWRMAGILAEDSTPARWVLRGREFVITATAGGSVSCLDPANGRMIWGFTEAGHNPRSITVAGDLALLHLGPVPSSSSERAKPPAKPARLGALHLRPGGASVAWETDPELGACGVTPVAAWKGRAYAFFNKAKTLAVLDLSDGRVLARRPAPYESISFLGVFDGRLIVERGDAYRPAAEYWMVDAEPEKFQTAEVVSWKAAHAPTLLYPGLRVLPYANGIFIARGVDALHAYDLRRPPAP